MAIRTCSSNCWPSCSLAWLHTLLAQKSEGWWKFSVTFYSNICYQGSASSVVLTVGAVLTIHPVSKISISSFSELIRQHYPQDSISHIGMYISIIHISFNKIISRWRSTTFTRHVCHWLQMWFATFQCWGMGARIQQWVNQKKIVKLLAIYDQILQFRHRHLH